MNLANSGLNIIGDLPSISNNVKIRKKVVIGDNSFISQNCSLSGEGVGIYIGNQVMIAPNAVIEAFNHGFTKHLLFR